MTSYIFGKGGHARVIASLLDGDVAFVDGKDEDAFFARPPARGVRCYIGIGDNAIRTRIFERLVAAGITPAICVAPNAFIAKSVELSPGVVICPGAVVNANARIGKNVIVNTLSGVDHDGVVGDHSQITVGVTFAGGVTVGRNCFFGIKSAVFPGVTIGDNVIVRGGALVTKNVGSNVKIGGIPAVPIEDDWPQQM